MIKKKFDSNVLKIKPSVTQVYQHKEFRTTSRLVQSNPVQYNPDQTSPEQANAKSTQFEQNSEFRIHKHHGTPKVFTKRKLA